MKEKTTNILFAGIGGQGIIRASDILAEAAFSAGFDVKKSEIHGMSQRGGSVSSDVRFGKKVLSPMIPQGECDYLVVLDESQTPLVIDMLNKTGKLIETSEKLEGLVPNKRTLNIALLGVLSRYLSEIPQDLWQAAIEKGFSDKPQLVDMNLQAFAIGRTFKP